MAQLDLFSTAQKIPNSAPGLRKEYDMQPILDNLKPIADLCEYFNTTNLTGTVLKERQFRAGSQNSVILKFFSDRPGELRTPFEIWECLILCNKIHRKTPDTSIRRSMTTLTKMGYLVKTDVKRAGEYGDETHCWRLK
jgi:hypothetical protein